jgi:very-short-patch-repair endonuclease/polyhydroxyalkanoate synthesis regulator phasin
MYGISSSGKEAIGIAVEKMFDRLAYHLLGNIPKLRDKKMEFFGSQPKFSLAHIFLQAMNNKEPNIFERDVLRSILNSSYGYIEGLRGKTSSDVTEAVDALVKEAKTRGEHVTANQVTDIISEHMEKARSHMRLIAEAETTKTRNMGHTMEIVGRTEAQGIEDPTVFFIIVRDGQACSECVKLHMMPDGVTPKTYKMSELSMGYHKRGEDRPSACGEHPHCFTSRNAHIYTEHAGYLRIDKVKIGDRVLTHTGKFKTVLDTLENWTKPYNGKMIKVFFEGTRKSNGKNHWKKQQSLSVTPEHQFLTSRGWVEARNLTENDELMQLYSTCSSCNYEMPIKWGNDKRNNLKGIFCSKKCMASFQWKDPDHKKNISIKSAKQMTEFAKNNPERMLELMFKANEATRELIKKGEFWAQKEENKEFLALHRAKLNSLMPRISKEESVFINEVREFYPTLAPQQLMHKWTVDGVIEDLKVILEYDGGGHYLPVLSGKMTMENFLKKQAGRDSYLQKCGYHVLRYGPGYEMNKIVEDIERVSKNSLGQYFYKPLKINKLEYGQASMQKLYDLTVEDDESFVVNGIVSHNCRCSLAELPTGWGFKNGFVSFVSLDHDEYKEQHEES